MFATVELVKELTNADVTQQTVAMAQSIIESYVGRVEAEVINANDLMLLGKATAYQARYMFNDEEKVFEQMSVAQVAQFGSAVSFKSGDNVSPWVAPLAVIACHKLSWKRMRSVRTGSIFYTPPVADEWSTL